MVQEKNKTLVRSRSDGEASYIHAVIDGGKYGWQNPVAKPTVVSIDRSIKPWLVANGRNALLRILTNRDGIVARGILLRFLNDLA